MKIYNERELENIGTKAADIDCNDFMKICKKCIKKCSSLTIDSALPAKNYSRFRKNLLDLL